ncbi:MAG: AAA family ATPase [Sciscionella sp.]|nr:AAA family ATPase [Sciscionella sp.]
MARYILTGTPGAGKTAVLRLLEVNGYRVVEESATDVIALETARGRENPWSDPSFVDKIITLQRQRQLALGPSHAQPAFFDRSPVCTLALSRYLEFEPSQLLRDEIERIIDGGVYDPTVFFIRNQGSIHNTAARQISFADSLDFERIHEQTYRSLGFQLVIVPPAPVDDRVALIRRVVGSA